MPRTKKNYNKRVTRVLSKKGMPKLEKASRERLFGTYNVASKADRKYGGDSRYEGALSWEEIDAIPCIGEEDC